VSINRAFGLSFLSALIIQALLWFVDPTTSLGIVGGWFKYLSLVLLGVLLGHAGHSYVTAFANAWPFALLWATVGYLRAHIPGAQVSPEVVHTAQSYGWWIFLFGALFMLPVVFAASAVGIWLAKTIWRRANGAGAA
jgi:hypothetical protein